MLWKFIIFYANLFSARFFSLSKILEILFIYFFAKSTFTITIIGIAKTEVAFLGLCTRIIILFQVTSMAVVNSNIICSRATAINVNFDDRFDVQHHLGRHTHLPLVLLVMVVVVVVIPVIVVFWLISVTGARGRSCSTTAATCPRSAPSRR